MKIPFRKIFLFTLLLFLSAGNVITSWAELDVPIEKIIAEYEKQFPFIDILDFEMFDNEVESEQFEGQANYALKENVYVCYMQFQNHIVLHEIEPSTVEEPLYISGVFNKTGGINFNHPQFYNKEQALMLETVPLFISIKNKEDDLNNASDKLSSFYEKETNQISSLIQQLDSQIFEIENQISLVEHDFTNARKHDKLIVPYKLIISELKRKSNQLISQRSEQVEKYIYSDVKSVIEALSKGESFSQDYCLDAHEYIDDDM